MKKRKRPTATYSDNIRIKKEYGQHFLRDISVVNAVVESVLLDETTSVIEVGCGDGVLTQAILRYPIKQLVVYEIDSEWAAYVQRKCNDSRLIINRENFLAADVASVIQNGRWVLLGNLPYNITFPILQKLFELRNVLAEGTIMVQEEVAQKIIAQRGRGYGYSSLFYQRYFHWNKGVKIPPAAFEPPPKVQSRLLHFTPNKNVAVIAYEDRFWQFIARCFQQPRRTLLNNLKQSLYDVTQLPDSLLQLRAQQLSMDDLVAVWMIIISQE